MAEESGKGHKTLRTMTLVFFAVVLTTNAIFLFVSVMLPALGGGTYVAEASTDRYISISFSAAIAVLVALSLRYVAGNIEFEVIGFKLRVSHWGSVNPPALAGKDSYLLLLLPLRGEGWEEG